MMRFLFLALSLFASPATGGVIEAVDLTERFYQDFETQSGLLEKTATESCAHEALIPAYHNAFDAWVTASTVQFGPIEEVGGALSIAFWPDKKGFTVKALRRLIENDTAAIEDEKQFAEVSIAAKGFFALEFLLFDAEFNTYSDNDAACSLVKAISKDIAKKARRINDLWQMHFSNFILTAGQSGNTVFLSKKEATQAYLTSAIGTLKFIETARLARPLGTFEKPRPKRAEAWRSERSLRNIEMSLNAVEQLVIALSDGQAPITMEEVSTALDFLPTIGDKGFQSITETSVRFKVESLLQMVLNIKEAASEELSLHLGVTTGFNALDGD